MRNLLNKSSSQKGSLLIEALAMLGLIALVTPLLYKKAAERTSEIQDINAAGQMRTITNAVDDYMRDNYDEIVTNGSVVSKCAGGNNSVTYSWGASVDANKTVSLAHFCEYLPYGFSETSRAFSDIKVVIKKRSFDSGKRQVLSALVVASPMVGASMQRVRASRIASMIGTNGGYTDNKIAYGVQGVWKIDLEDFKEGTFNPTNVINNSIVTTSLQSVASGNHGRENVLHRVRIEEDPSLNTMATTLGMGNHDIQDIKQLVVTGKNLSAKEDAVLLKDGTGLKVEGGSINVISGGTLNVDGKGTFNNDVEIGKHLKANTAEIVSWLKAGTAEIAGQLTAAGGSFEVDGSGNVTVGKGGSNNLTVTGNADIKGNMDIGGNTKMKGTLDIDKKTSIGNPVATAGDLTNVLLDVNGNAIFRNDVQIKGTLDLDNLNVRRVFKAGLLDNSTEYNMLVDKTQVDILVNNFLVGSPESGSAGFSVGDSLIRAKAASLAFGTAAKPNSMVIDADGVGVNDVGFRVNKGTDKTLFEVDQTNSIVSVRGDADFIASSNASGNVFVIDTDHNTGTKPSGSIYVRKGVIEMERGLEANKADSTKYASYVKLDRVVSNKALETDAFHAENTGIKYEEYQVNPAYTSVMHDIKLTTRGGARLSDILPDFINKGIYVLDGTYKEELNGKSINWNTNDSGVPIASSQFPYDLNRIMSGGNVIDAVKAEDCPSNDFLCPTTPWLGFIPAPTCPPGYLKVATISPIRWAMAQAGRTARSHRPGAHAKEAWIVYNRDPNAVLDGTGGVTDPWKQALTFQQSTWLNTSLKAFVKNGVSYGWSGIIGFVYNAKDYGTYLVAIGEFSSIGSIASDDVVWNLFEVYNQEITGIANVYCYFNRRSKAQLVAAGSTREPDFSNDTLIDRYDQMTSLRTGYAQKDANYVKRLNDPTMKYTDPW